MTDQQVPPGNEAEFVVRPILCFALVNSDIRVGKVISPDEMSKMASAMAEFDLSQYSKGITVTLSEVGSKYQFTAGKY